MLLIWMVYRVWGMRSCGREQGQGERTTVSPKGPQHQPSPCAASDPLALGSPHPKPCLVGPQLPPQDYRGSP